MGRELTLLASRFMVPVFEYSVFAMLPMLLVGAAPTAPVSVSGDWHKAAALADGIEEDAVGS